MLTERGPGGQELLCHKQVEYIYLLDKLYPQKYIQITGIVLNMTGEGSVVKLDLDVLSAEQQEKLRQFKVSTLS